MGMADLKLWEDRLRDTALDYASLSWKDEGIWRDETEEGRRRGTYLSRAETLLFPFPMAPGCSRGHRGEED